MRMPSLVTWRAALFRLGVFLALWWVLAEGETYRAWIGLMAAAAATAVSLRVWRVREQPLPWRALMDFVPYFLWHSCLAGFDVTRRAFSRPLAVEPALKRFELRIRDGRARAFLAWTVSLFPGTAGIRLHEDALDVHLLDTHFLTEHGLHEIERKVAALFGERIGGPGRSKRRS
jgi:multicomponent Na+:H+ antiporter subunit E